ncbi:MAG TPA: acyltransferase [bacterium]|nr:acyltransferase [bacterium]HQG44483.1 acyltransferase [bacterium]HQI47423.1 acyltransferase [bacterium]HQJ63837.1 acyltransferase [bacterium]
MYKNYWNLLKEKYRHLLYLKEIGKYDRFTKAEFFRKQGAQIGEGCAIIVDTLGQEPYLIKIGNRVTIANFVQFVNHHGETWVCREEDPNVQMFGPIIIDDNCVIGQSVILLPNIHIGANCIIGAGSVVVNDIPPNSIAMGVPARVLGSTDKLKAKAIETWKWQQPPDMEIEPGANWYTSRHFHENRERLRRHLVHLYWEGGLEQMANQPQAAKPTTQPTPETDQR